MDKSELLAREKQILSDYKRGTVPYLRELKKFLKEAEKAEDLSYIARINLSIAICYFELGNRINILPYAVKAAEVFETLNEQNQLASSFNIVGLAYRATGNYIRAVEYYERAIKTIHGLKEPFVRKDVILSNIAEAYFLMGEYKVAARLLKRCVSVIRTKHPEDHVSAVIYAINISDAYEALGELEKAIDALDAAVNDAELSDRKALLWGYYARRSCVLYKLGRVDEAQRYADLTIDSVHTGYDSYEFHRDFEKIARLEVEAGDLVRAQQFADILADYAEKNKNTIDLIIAKRVEANICDSRGDCDRLFALYKELSALYEKRVKEQNAIKNDSQKRVELASKEIASLMKKIRLNEDKAERDPLSGLLNRAALVSMTNDFIQKAKTARKKLGGIFIDIDYFKEFNDTYGHAAGDDVIRVVAGICMEEESDTVKFFRYGGDEIFGIVLDHKDAEIEALALRIVERVHASGVEHRKNPRGQRLTVSVGIANIDMKQANNTMLDIIRNTDSALYRAKNYGRDAVFALHVESDSEQEFRRIVAQT